MNSAAARTDLELRMTESMVDCAHSLGVSFADAAKVESDVERRLKLYDAFHRSFQSVRLGIRLSLTLRSVPAQPASAPAAAQVDAVEPEEADGSERETLLPRAERERGDREADNEPVSLTKFLATLRGVAADAAREPAVADPAVLTTLQGLLAQVETSAPQPKPTAATAGVALLTRPAMAQVPKAHLLGSTAPPLPLGLAQRPLPRPSG